jgi:hypothetical protein
VVAPIEDRLLREQTKRCDWDHEVQAEVSYSYEKCEESVSKKSVGPPGLGSFSTYAHGLGCGLHAFAASRLVIIVAGPKNGSV